jgi:serine/threonine protein kinase
MIKLLHKKSIGSIFEISEKLLGNGSYGKVYLATDENNNKYAVKCCDIEENGIPNILETTIMNSIIHPSINNSLLITVSHKQLYIFQSLALMDLAQKTRRMNYLIDNINDLKKWCYDLSQAIFCLHEQNIIHCDIKASNVLLFMNNNIKLTDFTLSIKQWSPNQTFNHTVCTRTHRPLECFLNEEWNKSLDIWSLGCTFYELAYGTLLFVDQKESENKKYSFINALLYWAHINEEEKYKNHDYFPVDYVKPKIFSSLLTRDTDEELFKDLLLKMLIVDKNNRYTIKQVLSHPFFSTIKNNAPSIYKTIKNKDIIKDDDLKFIKEKIGKFDKITQNIIIYIYNLCFDLNIEQNLKLEVCVLIASKINNTIADDIKNFFTFKREELITIERDICHHLNFHLLNF